jgi:gliding motility-associated-like protein
MPLIKKNLFFVMLVTILLLCIVNVHAQGLSATLTSTRSICYDDGSLTLNTSGGSGPYTLTLLTGPPDPNIIYPVSLATGLSTFGGLPSGAFTVGVVDAAGDTGTFSAFVAGTYQFPSLTFSPVVNGSIVSSVSSGLGPYSYSISSTGSNVGFGPYQLSDTFSHLCPGLYWIRVTDSCGNIYTNEIDITDTLTAQLNCINFSKGTLDITAAGGTAPYTYTIEGQTNTTGNFTGLGSYFSDSLVIKDGCGNRYVEFFSPPSLSLVEHCPSDSIIYLADLSFPFSSDTFTFICTNCIPAQSVTILYTAPIGPDPLFRHQAPGLNYNIIILSSDCGGDTIQHPPITIISNITIGVTYISCRSVQVTVSNGPAQITVDSFVLSYVAYGPTLQSNSTGLFEQLPDSNYIVTAYIGGLCNDTPRANITIPYFGNGCFTLMKDSICQNAWEYSTNSIVPELYSLILAPGDTIASAPGSGDNSNFYELPSGMTYILISDSGCAMGLKTPPNINPAIAVNAYLPCVGQPVLQFTIPPFSYCGGSNMPSQSQVRIQVKYVDSTIYDNYALTGNPTLVNISQSGWYHYTIFTVNTADTSSALRYDTLCPIDTGSVFMDNIQVPYLFSTLALVCDSGSATDSVVYYVYGGSAPYTVEIQGYDTVTLMSSTGIFPTRQAGTYTMLVYDNCGISRSMTFEIVDTCSTCPYAYISLPDTFSCAGDTVILKSFAVHAKTYQWYVNGTLYSTAADTSIVSGPGRNNIMLIVVSATGCMDTAYAHTTDTCNGCPYVAVDMPDTLYCIGDTVHLISGSIGGLFFRWNINGIPYSSTQDTTFIISSAGNYNFILNVTSATACTKSVSLLINVIAPYVINLGPDTTYCGSFNAILNTGIPSTEWSTGQTGPQITVAAPGTYTAVASNRCGTTTASIALSEKPIPIVDLGNDTTLCESGKIILNAGDTGDTYLWQDSSTGQTFNVTATGTYTVTVTQNGCSAADGIDVRFIHVPAPFYLGNDTTICSIYPLLLEAYQPDAYYIWNTGSTESFIYVDESGRYLITDSNQCGAISDSINITVTKCTCLVQIPTAFSPNNDGLNDTYGAIAPCTPENFLLEIYNRWGQKLFSSDNINTRWDGIYKNQEQPLGVYVYVMKYTDPYTKIAYTQTGNVTLVR